MSFTHQLKPHDTLWCQSNSSFSALTEEPRPRSFERHKQIVKGNFVPLDETHNTPEVFVSLNIVSFDLKHL